jgi:hypothetical protein
MNLLDVYRINLVKPDGENTAIQLYNKLPCELFDPDFPKCGYLIFLFIRRAVSFKSCFTFVNFHFTKIEFYRHTSQRVTEWIILHTTFMFLHF